MSGSTPTQRQLALFSTLEDIHELTAALVVLLTDEDGALVAVAGDEDDVPQDLRVVLSGKKLAAAGSVRALLEPVDLSSSSINVSIFAAGTMLLAILFDAESDLGTVQSVGKQASDQIAQILTATSAN